MTTTALGGFTVLDKTRQSTGRVKGSRVTVLTATGFHDDIHGAACCSSDLFSQLFLFLFSFEMLHSFDRYDNRGRHADGKIKRQNMAAANVLFWYERIRKNPTFKVLLKFPTFPRMLCNNNMCSTFPQTLFLTAWHKFVGAVVKTSPLTLSSRGIHREEGNMAGVFLYGNRTEKDVCSSRAAWQCRVVHPAASSTFLMSDGSKSFAGAVGTKAGEDDWCIDALQDKSAARRLSWHIWKVATDTKDEPPCWKNRTARDDLRVLNRIGRKPDGKSFYSLLVGMLTPELLSCRFLGKKLIFKVNYLKIKSPDEQVKKPALLLEGKNTCSF